MTDSSAATLCSRSSAPIDADARELLGVLRHERGMPRCDLLRDLGPEWSEERLDSTARWLCEQGLAVRFVDDDQLVEPKRVLALRPTAEGFDLGFNLRNERPTPTLNSDELALLGKLESGWTARQQLLRSLGSEWTEDRFERAARGLSGLGLTRILVDEEQNPWRVCSLRLEPEGLRLRAELPI
jgi:hypothetical protein